MSKKKSTEVFVPFTYEEFLQIQLQLIESFEKSLNVLFIELVANKKLDTRQALISLLEGMRKTTSWYLKINQAMLEKNGNNGKKVLEKKIKLN